MSRETSTVHTSFFNLELLKSRSTKLLLQFERWNSLVIYTQKVGRSLSENLEYPTRKYFTQLL